MRPGSSQVLDNSFSIVFKDVNNYTKFNTICMKKNIVHFTLFASVVCQEG
jgi:hypothetical protein